MLQTMFKRGLYGFSMLQKIPTVDLTNILAGKVLSS